DFFDNSRRDWSHFLVVHTSKIIWPDGAMGGDFAVGAAEEEGLEDFGDGVGGAGGFFEAKSVGHGGWDEGGSQVGPGAGVAVGAGHSFDEMDIAVVLPAGWSSWADIQGAVAEVAAIIGHLSRDVKQNFVFGVEFRFVIRHPQRRLFRLLRCTVFRRFNFESFC